MYTLKKIALLPLIFLYINYIYAQQKFTLNGYIKDSLSAETLISANVTVREEGRGVTSNQYGFFLMLVMLPN